MDRKPSADSKEPPAPEVLHPRDASVTESTKSTTAAPSSKSSRPLRRTYRPSHKATFLGLTVIITLLAINAAAIGFVLKSQSKGKSSASPTNQVTISSSALSKLGVDRSQVGNLGEQLIVGPDARFNGKVTIGGDASIGGQLTLNSKFSASDASLAQVEAGNTTVNNLQVNGNSSFTNVALKNNLGVSGTTTLQGAVTITQLLTVNNSANISGNLSVGGLLAVNSLHVSSFIADSSVTYSGHVITRGEAPSLSRGSCLGSLDSVSNSGNDQAGTIAVNTDTNGLNAGHAACTVATLNFTQAYSNIPHVLVTAVGPVYGGSVYVFRSATGFTLGITGSLPASSSYAFDYIVEQ
ncbi:MAG TPA: hypothetical protein VFN56_02125 [Candidatus Saccharimonadales bacterium]|nr:hypothetical protein [Candidatus Saccharimonadales bacterium]